MCDFDEDEVEEYFTQFAGEDELLTRRELKKLLKAKLEDDDCEEKRLRVRRLFRKMDEDEDGKVSLDEFKKLVEGEGITFGKGKRDKRDKRDKQDKRDKRDKQDKEDKRDKEDKEDK